LIKIIRNKDKKATNPIHINREECVKEISKDPRDSGINGISSNCSNGLEIIENYMNLKYYAPPHQ
jgi:hypothetical protein